MIPPRFVLDTNVLVSALLFRQGSVAWLRRAWRSGAIRPLASHATTAELTRVLTYPKFALAASARDAILRGYLPWCETVLVPNSTRVPDCRDPDDRPFLALCIAAGADALITGDKDLIALADGFTAPILTPAETMERFGLSNG